MVLGGSAWIGFDFDRLGVGLAVDSQSYGVVTGSEDFHATLAWTTLSCGGLAARGTYWRGFAAGGR
jgi:hypothetical protein